MRIFNDIENLPRLKNPVVTVGSFDGVHLGHQRILAYLKEAAAKYEGESVVVTFSPHPQQVLYPGNDFFLINTIEENAELIEEQGIDNLIIINFTLQFAQLTYDQFLHLLIEKIGMRALVMGPDHNFGRNREGNRSSMRDFCKKNSIEIIQIPELLMEENKVCSSKIRKFLINKELEEAERLLGHPLKKK